MIGEREREIERENMQTSTLYHPHSGNQRKRKKRLVHRPCQKTYEAVEHHSDSDTSLMCALRTIPKSLVKTWKSENHSNYSIVKIGQNTEVSKRLDVTCCHSASRERQLANTGMKISIGESFNK